MLPLCVRCSSVYAGVLCGAALEAWLRWRTRARPGAFGYWLSVAAFAAMGLVGFGNVYGLFGASVGVKVLSSMAFGAAMSFFAVAALSHVTDVEFRRAEAPAPRVGLLGLFALWSALAHWGTRPALIAMGAAAAAGLAVAFLLVNLTVALLCLSRLPSPRRAWIAAVATLALIAVEFTLFRLWRSGL